MYNAIYDTLIIGKKVIYLPSCHSTNDIAAELVLKGLDVEGTIVITDNQYKGKGQRGTDWHSEPAKNLTFSIILKPKFLPIPEQFLLSQAISLAVFNYCVEHTSAAKIKWPNDIYIGTKKVSGTLIENSIQGATLGNSIVGIGVNINQTTFSNPRSASLASISGSQFALEAEFYKIVQHLDKWYSKLRSPENKDLIRSEYLDNLIGYNRISTFRLNGDLVEGTVLGLTQFGKLIIEINSSSQEFGLKEIEWVFDA